MVGPNPIAGAEFNMKHKRKNFYSFDSYENRTCIFIFECECGWKCKFVLKFKDVYKITRHLKRELGTYVEKNYPLIAEVIESKHPELLMERREYADFEI